MSDLDYNLCEANQNDVEYMQEVARNLLQEGEV